MKKLVLALVACLGLAGCAIEESTYAQVQVQTMEVCDNYGCHLVAVQYYGGYPYYYNAAYGVWISPGYGYFYGSRFYRGYHPGYHNYYHGGFRGGSRGNFHGGGFHGHGGHGGHR
ncbi:MAG TPA: hypothetical protein VII94_02265 [Candidatus Saccharimonadales bacterium]